MEKEKADGKGFKNISHKEMLKPEERFRSLLQRTEVEVDHNLPPQRYYRGGVEMIRMAKIYMAEGSIDNAYILYMKFMTIFVEKIQDHPKYKTVSLKDREANKKMLREVLPKAEELKAQLLEQYKSEYAKYLQEEQRREEEAERQEREEQQRLQEEQERRNKTSELIASNKDRKVAIAAGAITTGDQGKANKLPTILPKIFNKTDITSGHGSYDIKTPNIDRSTKPSLLTSDKLSLRDVILPDKLMHHFLKLAFQNTMSNKETCGILAGKLERNRLLVTHLLIPAQTGSPDSCITHNEETIFDYQDQHNLITLGWIHTHPTQTAFLSSVDLHTHCAYQLMMAEAIAIVCAPKYEETGFFMLTPDYGLDFIANCREAGFHPHPTEPPLYMTAKHCKLDSTARVEVVDLRKK